MRVELLILFFLTCFFVEAKKKTQVRYLLFKDVNFRTQGHSVLRVKLDDWFIIQLNANPTTGYEWNLENYDKLKKVTTNSTEGQGYYIPDKVESGITGFGGVERYFFNAVRNGAQKIRLSYRRPWESQSGIIV